MKQQDRKPKIDRRPARLGALTAALLCLGLLAATPVSAAYEQIGNFAGTPGVLKLNPNKSESWPEEVQLGGVGGMAVNLSGAGGVPPGTFYAGTYGEGGARVARFDPNGAFRAAWTFEGDPPKERCGPDGDPAHPVCKSQPSASSWVDVDVDQTTGYVYVLDGTSGVLPGTNRVHVYSADGSELISEFGEKAPAGGSTASSPEKIHDSPGTGNLAVDASGVVYVFDQNFPDNFYHRLMVFEPQIPGDYENYVYAGQGRDIWAGFHGETLYPTKPILDAAGNLYVAQEGGYIAKLDPSQPSAPALCEFDFAKGGVDSVTVDPDSGTVFFYSHNDRMVHQLEPCAAGEFVETSKFPLSPKRKRIEAMAFNPVRQFAPGRPPGVLYAGAPSGEGGNSEGEGSDRKEEASLGYIFSRPLELPPEVGSESISHVTATTAQLHAQVNPKGSATRYTFQYLTEAQYEANEPADRFAGATEAPAGGAVVGEGTVTLDVAASLAGLTPDTAYRYRAVATSNCSAEDPGKVCEGTGADERFRTFPVEAPGLPDKRVYELVSPVQKHGGQVLPADPRVSSCGEGDCKPGTTYQHFPMQSSPDGNAVVYEGTAFDSEQSALFENQFIARRDPKAGWQSTNLTPTRLSTGGGLGYKAFDTELTQGVLEQFGPALTPGVPSEYDNFYSQPTVDPLALGSLLSAEPPNRPATDGSRFVLGFAGAAADLSRVFFAANDALTAETPFAPEAVDGGPTKNNLYEWEPATGQLHLVNVMPGNAATQPGAAFGAGSAHTISADGSRAFWSDETGQLYVREDAEVTREISDPGKFLSASLDGSEVLLDNGHLHDLETETTVDLTEGEGGFEGIAGQSDDLSRVYFVATTVLSGEEENSEGAKAQAGKFNLYAWGEGPTRFVATLVAADNSGVLASDWAASPASRTAEASPQGRFLAFVSKVPLTGYDNVGLCDSDPAGYVDAPCPEVFLYDSASGELTCPSCNPSGARPLGWSTLRLIYATPRFLPQPRYLSDSGRLFFDSRDSLIPADTNDGVEDVYQYEPDGVGSCEREMGCVSLISAGTGIVDSNFLAADPSGQNVFFTTRDQLVLKDKDELIDLYDARVEGGTPAETEVARGECQGEACVPALSPPNDPTPGSSSFEGAGNVDEKKAQKKSKKKRKQAKKKKRNKRAKARANNNRGGAK